MNYDYYASLAEQESCPKKINEGGLASGFVDGCLVWSCCGNKAKNDARRYYMKRASDLKVLKLPPDLDLEPDFTKLPDPAWIGIEVEFELLTPWYSKDDRPFHVLDNPVRKDRVFGVPFMSAASWKGLLRWAFKISTGMINLGDKNLSEEDNKRFKKQEVFLFGNERGEGEEFSRGALVFYPTWFSEVGFEVINPHKRATRAGTKPIYYEVVKAETEGVLRLLYAPLQGEIENDKLKPADFIDSLIDSITALLETYGISAKGTAGWGTVEVKSCSLFFMKGSWFEKTAGSDGDRKYTPPEDKFNALMDENGCPIKILLDETEKLLSKTQFKKLGDKKPDCTNTDFEFFKEWYEKYGEEHKRRLNGAGDRERSSRTVKRSFDSLAGFKTILKNSLKGGPQ